MMTCAVMQLLELFEDKGAFIFGMFDMVSDKIR